MGRHHGFFFKTVACIETKLGTSARDTNKRNDLIVESSNEGNTKYIQLRWKGFYAPIFLVLSFALSSPWFATSPLRFLPTLPLAQLPEVPRVASILNKDTRFSWGQTPMTENQFTANNLHTLITSNACICRWYEPPIASFSRLSSLSHFHFHFNLNSILTSLSISLQPPRVPNHMITLSKAVLSDYITPSFRSITTPSTTRASSFRIVPPGIILTCMTASS